MTATLYQSRHRPRNTGRKATFVLKLCFGFSGGKKKIHHTLLNMPLQNISIQILIDQIQTQHSSVLSGVETLITGEKKKKA